MAREMAACKRRRKVALMEETAVVIAPGMASELDETLQLVREHEAWRARCLNLIASENAYSKSLLALLSSDLEQRYANYLGRDRGQRTYRGTRFVEQIEDRAEQLAKRVFDAKYVELRSISGQVAGVAVVSALGTPGATVLELGRAAGGHQVAARMVTVPLINLVVSDLAFDVDAYNVDVEKAVEQIGRLRPRLVIVGSSLFLFPHPVRALAAEVHKHGGLLAYDASHVLGLIAGGGFQLPLEEGADVVFGSTHKTFPGPQGGIIYTDNEDMINRVSAGVYPALVTNHHVARMPAMVVALSEMQQWAPAYGKAVIQNARVLGQSLSDIGVRVVAADRGWTASHTLLLMPDPKQTAREWALALEAANIITTAVPLPAKLGGEGIRIGTQELTRRGATPSDMTTVASLIARVFGGEDPEHVAPDTGDVARRFVELCYSVDALSS
jgi:glycine hydroxymethyltransferase